MCNSSPYTAGVAVKQEVKPLTVGEDLDQRIKAAREQVERLCVLKAKAEALNVLDHPIDFYQDMVLF